MTEKQEIELLLRERECMRGILELGIAIYLDTERDCGV